MPFSPSLFFSGSYVIVSELTSKATRKTYSIEVFGINESLGDAASNLFLQVRMVPGSVSTETKHGAGSILTQAHRSRR